MPVLPDNRALRIAILAFPGCMGSEILAINDVLLLAGHIARAQRTAPLALSRVEVVGLSGRPVTLAGGISLAVVRPHGRYDVLIVPGLEISQLNDWDAKLAPLQRELAFVRKSFSSGSAIASICVGSFLLAEAGLLDGRKVTTAWLCVPQLARRYPAVAVQPDAVMVEDGAVLTTGAVSSAFDLAILLVKRTLGARVATATARVALLSAQRVSQAPYVDSALIAPSLPSFSQSVAQWLRSRLTEAYDLDRVAQAFHVSSRTLLRRVKVETGRSPLVLLQQARIDKAKQLLLETRWSQDRITEAVGYADTGTFSRLFAKQVGISPARFRRQGI